MSSTRTSGPLLVAVALLLAGGIGFFLLFFDAGDEVGGRARSGAADGAAPDSTTSEPVELADRSDLASPTALDEFGRADAGGAAPTGRARVDASRSWRDVIQPHGARTGAALETFEVVVIRPDGSRTEFDADAVRPGAASLADALVAIVGDGHCPRFTTGPELERATDYERRAKLVPRATLTITTDRTSPWFHEIDALQVVRGDLATRLWAHDDTLDGPQARADFMAFAAALRATLDPSLSNAARAEHFAFGRDHAAFSRVTSLAHVEPPLAFYAPFAAYRFAGPVALPLTLDPVATNGTLQIGVRSAGAFRLDSDPERTDARPFGAAQHLERPFRLEPDQELTTELVFVPQSSIVARFPTGATDKGWYLTVHWSSDGAASSHSTGSYVDDAQDLVEARGLLPGEYVVSASWLDVEGVESHTLIEFELEAGTQHDLGTFTADPASVVTIVPRFYHLDHENVERAVDPQTLATVTGTLELTDPDEPFGGTMAQRLLLSDRERRFVGEPIALRGLAEGSWEARLVDVDLGDVPWLLASEQTTLAFTMPGHVEAELPVRLTAKSPLEVRLYVPDDVLTSGIRFAADLHRGGGQGERVPGFRWEPGGGAVQPHAASSTSVPPGSTTVVARAFFPADHPSEPASVWIATTEVLATPPAPLAVDLVLAPSATATIAADVLASEAFAAVLGPAPYGCPIESVVRDRATGGTVAQTLLPDDGGVSYRGLLPSTDYRFVGTDVVFTTGGPGSTVAAFE
ncbi:hypothetical protein Pla163_03330 [Planctomycetes bacterium Pla163]|uniref:Uncharacterized protein n=1 Tax=Rohdeia mirabilis TaxID=2528008 RepID=A0A518CVJ1_9BACT|nr:hypothetical protein Pla163_03330 [Planctomycetes bacterium Pla163]